MHPPSLLRPVHILLVDDNRGDVRLTLEAFKDARVQNFIHVAEDGVVAMEFLRREGKYADAPRPDLVLLDLNMPRMDGRAVLAAIKSDPELQSIPVIVLTTSEADADISSTYSMHANCFITKPVDFAQFLDVMTTLESFWLSIVKLPDE
jgi:chemotaxis family two-component system response regulator Rcp1